MIGHKDARGVQRIVLRESAIGDGRGRSQGNDLLAKLDLSTVSHWTMGLCGRSTIARGPSVSPNAVGTHVADAPESKRVSMLKYECLEMWSQLTTCTTNSVL